MTPLSHLHSLYMDYYSTKWPNFPKEKIPPPEYSDKTTSGLTKMVKDFINFSGGFIDDNQTMGRQIKAKSGKTIWIPTKAKKGRADLTGNLKGGQSIDIEIKCAATKDRIRKHQIEYAKAAQITGRIYLIATTFEDFYVQFMKITKNK